MSWLDILFGGQKQPPANLPGLGEAMRPHPISPTMLDVMFGRWPMPSLGESVVGVSNEGRPAYLNRDGSMSTERSATILNPDINQGAPTNIPTIFDGRWMGEDEASSYMLEHGRIPGSVPEAGMVVDPMTGRRAEPFGSIEQAERAARARSQMIRVLLDPAYKPIR